MELSLRKGDNLGSVDYSGAWLKLQRAEVHIGEVDFLIFQFLRRHTYKISQKVDLNSGEAGFEISLKELPPISISGALGDAVHNLRAALDLAISAIAASRGKRVDQTYFPFAKDRTEIESMIAKRAGMAGDEAMQICRELKPYQGGNDALWGLHQADITDKHRALIVAAAIGDFRYRLLPNGPDGGVTIETRIHDLSLEPYLVPAIEGREFQHPFELGLSIDIVFPVDGALAGYPVVATAYELLRMVRGILEKFEARCS